MAATHEDDDDNDDNEIVDTPPHRVTRSKMRRAPPPNPVVVAAELTVPVRLTRSKMTRKPGVVQTMSVPASVTKDDSTPTPSSDGFADPVTPATVVAKGSVYLHTNRLTAAVARCRCLECISVTPCDILLYSINCFRHHLKLCYSLNTSILSTSEIFMFNAQYKFINSFIHSLLLLLVLEKLILSVTKASFCPKWSVM